MRIGLSTLVYYPDRYAGVGAYVKHLTEAFAALEGEDEFLLVTARWNDAAFHYPNPRVRAHVTDAPYNHPLCALWEHRAIGRIARAEGLDLYHAPSNVAPLGVPCRLALTFHDLLPYRVPRSYSRARRLYWSLVMPRSLRRADVVITDTEACRRAILRRWRLEPARVVVVPLAVEAAHFAAVAAPAVRAMRARFGGPYVFWTGRPFGYKNLPRLIDGFAQVKRRAGLPHRLVLGGAEVAADPAVAAAIARTGQPEIFVMPGRLSFAELPAAYAAADAFAFPSLDEGFGLPVLEAMAAGTPVLTSKRDVLAETAGEAALLIDPERVEEIADGLARLLEDRALRENLIARGRARAAELTWQRTAEGTLAAYRLAAALPARP